MEQKIFSALDINHIHFKNRIIRSATHETLADGQGFPTKQLAQRYINLAKGGVGAIITGYLMVQPNGKCSYSQNLMIDRDECIDYYKNIIDNIRPFHTPIIAQLAHAGRQTRSKVIGYQPVAPSAIRDKHFDEDIPHELSDVEIRETINNFVQAIGRARQAGFDGVQLHLAHGYLLSEFLSPYSNRRKDQWGGNTENRYRIVSEIFRLAKNNHPDYPILVKLNAYDGRKNGMRLDEAIRIAHLLEQSGCAAIEVSCGTNEDNFLTSRTAINPVDAVLSYSHKCESIPKLFKPVFRMILSKLFTPIQPVRLYNVASAQAIKKSVSIPVIVVGGIRTISEIEKIINDDQADLTALCRPLILEPNLVNKFREGLQTESKCISCNYCQIALEKGPIHCYHGKIRLNLTR